MSTSTLPSSTRWALAALSLSMLLSSLGTSIANVGLPTLAQAFHASFAQVKWVVLAYLLSITVLIVFVGRLGDLFGRRRLLLTGIALFTAASAACGLAPSLEWLIAARAVQGLGAASMMALTTAFVSETVPKDKTGSAMGLLGTMSAIGTALGPSLGGLLLAHLDWRFIFHVNLPLGLLAWTLALRHLPRGRMTAQAGKGLDVRGSMLPALTRNTVALAMNLLVATVMMATLVVGPFYLTHGLALDAAHVGMVVAVGPVMSIALGVVAGRVVDRWGAQRMVLAGLLLLVLGVTALSAFAGSLSIAAYLLGIAILTPGYQLFQAANNTAVMAEVPAQQRGLVSGLLSLARNLGLIGGASFMGSVFALAVGSLEGATPLLVATGLRVTFAVAAGLVGVALVLAWSQAAVAKRQQRALVQGL